MHGVSFSAVYASSAFKREPLISMCRLTGSMAAPFLCQIGVASPYSLATLLRHARLCTPYPAADGHWQLCLARGCRSECYLAVYADTHERVEAPNVIGMNQFADGGVLGSKPHAADGN